jgi:hypothetical protein
LRIAGITTAIAGLTSEWSWPDRHSFETFYADEPPDIVLRVHGAHPGAGVEVGDLVYSLEGFRNVYLDRDTWAFEFRPRERGLNSQSPLDQLLVFDRGFTVGDLYVYPSKRSERPTLKFSLFLFELLGDMLPFRDGMMVHASGVSHAGQGIVFVGPSGAGKSTLAGLWQACHGVNVLHDDRVILRKKVDRWWAYPVAGIGEFRAASPEGVPLEAVFLLSHAEENFAKRRAISQAASALLSHISLAPYDAEAVSLGLQLLDDLLHEVPVYELGFLPDETAVDFVREVIA